MGKVFQIITLFAAVFVTGITAAAQDLGSSNKLFGGAKDVAPKSGSKAAKKTAAKVPSSNGHPHTAVTKHAVTSARKSTAAIKIHRKFKVKTPVKIAPPPTNAVRIAPRNNSAKDVSTNAEYERLIASGTAADSTRDFAATETAYKRAGLIRPNDPRAAFRLGGLYADSLRWEDAEKAYRTALALSQKDVGTLLALSYVLTQPVNAPNLSNRYDEAEKLARVALDLSPDLALSNEQLGVTMERRGLIGAETETAYRRAIQIDPTFAPAYAHLGRLLHRRGRTNEGDTAYSDAIARANNVLMILSVADTLQSEQRFAESVPLLRRALAIDARNPGALAMFGRALTATGNFDEAETALKRSIEVVPNSFTAYNLLGELYMRQNRFELAENVLINGSRFVAPFEKRDLAAQFETVGDGYRKSGNSNAAARAYKKSRELDPTRETLAAKILKS